MAFNYYPQFEAPIVQQGETVGYNWVNLGSTVYHDKPAAQAAAEASSYYGTYDMRIIKSSWEVVETLPKV